MKKKQKGFTLVELLVVIAIVAILATVSIVGYLSFTKKAKVSNDVSITTQMNTVLQANEASNKAKNMSEVRAQLLDNGLDIEKLSPTTAGYNYVWDTATNRILLLDDNNQKISPENVNDADTSDTFVVLHKSADLNKWVDANYSVYLASDYDGSSVEVTKVTGVDTGNSNVKNVTISGQEAETILVNGNLDKLTVNAPKATVNQYGVATTADIQAVDPTNSFHVFGQIVKLDVTSGHIVVETKGVVNTVTDKNTTAQTTVSVEIKVSANVGAVVSVKTDILVQGSQKPANPEVVVPNEQMNLFAGGIGTKDSPYLISTEEQFKNIDKVNSEYHYFKLLNDLKFDNSNIVNEAEYYCVIKKLYGSIDGNNNTIFVNYAENTKVFKLIYEIPYHLGVDPIVVTLKDLVVKFSHESFKTDVVKGATIVGDAFYKKTGPYIDTLIFDNVDAYGDVIYGSSANNVGVYGIYVQGNVVYKNCNNYVDISSMSYNAAFLGYVYGNNRNITFENCSYDGNFIGQNCGVLIGNLNGFDHKVSPISVKNFTMNGQLAYFGNEGLTRIVGAMKSSTPGAEQYLNEIEKTLPNNKISKLASLTGLSLSVDSTTKEISINYQDTNNKVSFYKISISKYNLMNKFDNKNGVTTEKAGTVLQSVDKIVTKPGKTGLFKYEFYQKNDFGGKYYNLNGIQSDALYALNDGQYKVLSSVNALYDLIEVNGNKAYMLKSNSLDSNRDKISVISNQSLTIKLYAFDANGSLIGYVSL